jgi:hypothetical protein
MIFPGKIRTVKMPHKKLKQGDLFRRQTDPKVNTYISFTCAREKVRYTQHSLTFLLTRTYGYSR